MNIKISSLLAILTLSLSAWSQGVGINETGANPHPSAILDVESTNKGFLPPRMTSVQMNAIANPATGLIVYCTDCNPLGLYQFGTTWTSVSGTTNPAVVHNCNANGFQGFFFSGLNYAGRSFSVTITNNTFSQVVLNFASSDLVLSGITGMTVGAPTGAPALSSGNATLAAGATVVVTYPITGGPASSGTLTGTWTKLSLNCTRTVEILANPYPANYNHCNAANPTAIVEVVNPTTNRTWMDRNLGANRAATTSTDVQAYGTLFQWGRRADGHQCVNRYTGDGVTTSATTATLSTVDAPTNGNFITINSGNNDWRNPQNNNLWQGLNGTNNPCPSTFRLPTDAELNAERLSWSNNNSTGAFNSTLKLPMAGLRSRVDALLSGAGTSGNYWSSTVNSTNANMLTFTTTTASETASTRAFGRSVRCIKEIVGALGALNCNDATNNGVLIEGAVASGVSTVIPYSGGNAGYYTSQSIASTGVTGLTATLNEGILANGAGNLTYTITGTPNSAGTASFAINIGGQSCTVNLAVQFDCAAAVHNGQLIENQAASGVNSVISYASGNGSSHSGQIVASTGVTGLTATLSAGTFANGAGTLTYTITGTATSGGTASFAINIGGQGCTLTRTIIATSVPNMCNPSNPTAIVDVTNAFTGRTWMDRNLGANRAATSSLDAQSYGSLYQWGRGSDGHQCVNRYAGDGVTTSANTALNATVSTDTPPHGNFILTNTGNNDWRSPQNNNLWQGVNGTNNPCPSGYRIPTEAELNNERLSWVQAPISSTNNAAGAFASPLKFPLAGYRDRSNGSLGNVGSYGYYWSSTVSSANVRVLYFFSSFADLSPSNRVYGYSVRCIKD